MNNWEDYADIICHGFDMENCAIKLGTSIMCDGFIKNRSTAIFTHYHTDHIKYFTKSLTHCDDVLTSDITKDALIALCGDALQYRQNFKSFRQGESFTTSTGEKIRFYDSNHVPGSVQVLVEIHDGTKILYSGDYNYPGIITPKCDILVLDSTHGDPHWSSYAEKKSVLRRFCELVHKEIVINKKPVTIKCHRGIMQILMMALESDNNLPQNLRYLANHKNIRLTDAINKHYNNMIRDVLYYKSNDALKIRNSKNPYIFFRTLGEESIHQEEYMHKIQIDSFVGFDSTIIEKPDMTRVNFESHSNYPHILEYVEAISPKVVITDTSRGSSGLKLSNLIHEKLNINAYPRPDFTT